MRRGYTLFETIVAMVIGFILVGAVLALLLSGVRCWAHGADQVETNEAAMVAMHAFQMHLGESHITSVYINPSGVTSGVSYLSAYDQNGQLAYVLTKCGAPPPGCAPPPCPSCSAGTTTFGPCACAMSTKPLPFTLDDFMLWQKREVLYFDSGTQTIRIATIPLPAPTPDPQPYRLDTFTPNLQKDHIIAENIKSLTVSTNPLDLPNPPPTLQSPTQNPVYVQIIAQKPGNSYALTLTSAVMLENGFDTGTNTGAACCSCPGVMCPPGCPGTKKCCSPPCCCQGMCNPGCGGGGAGCSGGGGGAGCSGGGGGGGP